MLSADRTETSTGTGLSRAGAAPRRAGAWFAALSLATLAPILPLWLFSTAPGPRRTAILTALGLALTCVAAIAAYQRATGGRQPYAAVARAEFSCTPQERQRTRRTPLPPSLPTRRGIQLRTFAWSLGACTALATLFALTLGTPDRPDLVQRISDAGAKFAEAPVVKATDIRFHDPSRGHDHFTSTATVRLPPDPGAQPATATVHPTTPDRPHAGDTIPVLYAPSNPALGAVPGTEQTLAATLNGSTLDTGHKLIVAITWTAGLALSVTGVSLRHGFRSFSRLRSTDMSVRVTCQGPDVWRRDSQKQLCLKVTAPSSRTAHFLTPISETHVPDSLVGQQLWLCWDASAGSSAALVSDTGWVMHGKLHPDDAQTLTPEATPATPNAPHRPLHLWNPTSAWPLYVPPPVLWLATLTIACAALLTSDVTGVWRWATGAAGAVATLTACYLATTTPHSSRGATRPARPTRHRSEAP